MAALPSLSPEEMIKYLDDETHLASIIRGCIQVDPAHPSTLLLDPSRSSLGALDQLPQELMLLLLEDLDFQSLSRILRTSRKGKAIVENLPAFVEMMEHAPRVLVALVKTKLITYHSATTLRRELRSQKCVSCLRFGSLLLLPTCERVCHVCLLHNHTMKMTTEGLAKRCFGLTDEQLKMIPIMHSIPGAYGFDDEKDTHQKPIRLVNGKQAKQLGLHIHGSEEKLAEFKPALDDTDETLAIHAFNELILEPPRCNMYLADINLTSRSRVPHTPIPPRLIPNPWKQPSSFLNGDVEDAFEGMALIHFPSLTSCGVDYGRFCEGCQHADRTSLASMSGPSPRGLSPELVPPGLEGNSDQLIRAYLEATAWQILTNAEFDEHIKYCHGVRLLLDQWQEENREIADRDE